MNHLLLDCANAEFIRATAAGALERVHLSRRPRSNSRTARHDSDAAVRIDTSHSCLLPNQQSTEAGGSPREPTISGRK